MNNNTIGTIEYDARINTKNLKADSARVQNMGRSAANSLGNDMDKGATKAGASMAKLGIVVGAVSGVVQNVLNRAINGFTSAISDAISRVDTLNNFPKVMANMGISADKAAKASKRIDEGLRGLPTTLDTASLAVQRLTTRTKDVGKSTDIFLALNNAVLAGAAPMHLQSAAMEQFAQAFSKGKPDMMEWRSILAAMPAQLDQVAKSMKIKSVDELGRMLREGEISMDKFSQAIVKLNSNGVGGLPNFAQQAKNSTQGIATGMTNMRTAVTRSVAKVMQAIGSANISRAFSNVGKTIEALTGTAIEFGKEAVDLGRQIGSYLAPKFKALGNSVKDLVPLLRQMYKESLQPLAAGLGKALVAGAGLAVDALNALIRVIKPLASFMYDNRAALMSFAAMFGTFAIAISIWDKVDRLRVAFNVLRLVTIPGLLASFGSFAALLTGPVGIAIAGVSIVAGFLTNNFMRNKTATDKAKAAADALRLSYDALKAAQDRLKNAQLGLEGSTLAVERAQKTYNETVRQYGPKSLEAREAAHNLKRAQYDLKKAHEEVAGAVKAQNSQETALARNHALINSAENKIKAMQRLRDSIGLSPSAPYQLPASNSPRRGDPLNILGNNAEGTNNWRGGPTWVGEKGPEIIDLPKRSRVIPNHEVDNFVGSSGRSTHIGNINISNELDGRYWLNKLTGSQEARLNGLTPQGGF